MGTEVELEQEAMKGLIVLNEVDLFKFTKSLGSGRLNMLKLGQRLAEVAPVLAPPPSSKKTKKFRNKSFPLYPFNCWPALWALP